MLRERLAGLRGTVWPDLLPLAATLLWASWVLFRLRQVQAWAGAWPAVAAVPVAAILSLLWWRSRLRRRRELRRLSAAVEAMTEGRFAGPLPPADGELASLTRPLGRMWASSEERAQQLERRRDYYREILAATSDGVLETGGDGRVRMITPAFRRLFEVAGEAEGRPLVDLVRQPELSELLRSVLETQSRREGNVALPSGLVVRLTGLPFHGSGALVVARNVTESVRTDETRRDFAANISHELKTPLTAIRGYAETLQEGALEEPEVAAKFVARILGQCRRLEALLADLLALSRLESAGFTDDGNLESIDLRRLCERALEVVSHSANAKQVSLELEGDELPPVTGYPEALERMLLNLLDNAIKYNRPGGWVRIRLERTEGEVVVEVRDGGIGIPERSLGRVFERFYRVDKGRARDEGGTGLGLALVKHAAVLHRGRVEVASELGHGSRFRVTLPLRGS